MLKFIIDKHVADAIVNQLRQRGITVVRAEDVNMGKAKDAEILTYAAQHDYAVITFDSDFQELHRQWLQQDRNHTGIFFCAHHLQGQSGIGRIVTVCAEFYELINSNAGTLKDDIHNQLYFIS